MNQSYLEKTPIDRKHRAGDIILLIVMGAILYLPFLGLRDIWTSGEARVAQVARQMRFTDDHKEWLIPKIGDDDRLKKPPLAYWLTVLASLPFDNVDEFSSRLPNVFAAIGVILLTYLFGCRLSGRTAGLISAVSIATTMVIWEQARTTGIEMPLLFFNTLAFYAWWRYHETVNLESDQNVKHGSLPWMLLCYTALGFSFLQKGPVGPPLVLIVIIAYLTITNGWRKGFSPIRHIAGILLMLAIALPWPLYVYNYVPDAVETWSRESAGRLEGFDHIKGPHYFILKILGDGQPWVLIALLSPWLLQFKKSEERKRILMPLVWATVTLVFFSSFASKKSYYILPIYPALSLLAGMVTADAAKAVSAVKDNLQMLFNICGITVTAIASTAAVALLLQEIGAANVLGLISNKTQISGIYQELLPQVLASVGIVLALGIIIIVKQRKPIFVSMTIASSIGLLFALQISMVPTRNHEKSDRPHCVWLRKNLLKGDERVLTYNMSKLPIKIYYASAPDFICDVNRINSPHRILTNLDANPTREIYILIKRKDYENLKAMYEIRTPDNATLNDAVSAIPKTRDVRLLSYRVHKNDAPDNAKPADSGWIVAYITAHNPKKPGKSINDPATATPLIKEQLKPLGVNITPISKRLEILEQPEWRSGLMWVRVKH